MFSTQIEFVTGKSSELSATGDWIGFLVLALIAVFLFAFYKLLKNINFKSSFAEATAKICTNKIVVALVIAFFIIFSCCFIGNSINAYAASVEKMDVTNTIKAKLDGNYLSIDKCVIKNNNDQNVMLKGLSLKQDKGTNCPNVWSILHNSNNIYNKSADGIKVDVDSFIIKAGEQAELSINCNMTEDEAISHNGDIFTLQYYFDYPSHIQAEEPNIISGLIYNGQEQTGVVSNETINISGTISATDAGTYQVTATPKEENYWPDKSCDPKTYQWTIDKANAKCSCDNIMVDIEKDASIEQSIEYIGDGTGSVKVEDQNIATASLSNNNLEIVGKSSGETKAQVSYAGGRNYKDCVLELGIYVTHNYTGTIYFPLFDDDGSFDLFDSSYNNMNFKWNPYTIFNSDNTVYNKDFAKLGICLNTDVLDGCRIAIDGIPEWNFFDSTTLYENLGMQDIRHIYVDSSYTTDVDDTTMAVVSHKKVTLNGENKEIIIVSICGTNVLYKNEVGSDLDVGALKADCYDAKEHPDWKDYTNHKGFDVAYNRLSDKIKTYINTYVSDNSEKAMFINGHSRGGSIGNLLGKEYELNPNYKSFAYCYATPAVSQEINYTKYKTIYNLINENDLIPYVPAASWGFHPLGTTIMGDIWKEEYQKEWQDHVNHKFTKFGAKELAQVLANLVKTRQEIYTADKLNEDEEYVWSDIYETKEDAQAGIEAKKAELKTYNLDDTIVYHDPSQTEEGYLAHISSTPYFVTKLMSNIFEYAKGNIVKYVLEGKTIEEISELIVDDVLEYITSVSDIFDYFPLFYEKYLTVLISAIEQMDVLVPGFLCGHSTITYYLLASI